MISIDFGTPPAAVRTLATDVETKFRAMGLVPDKAYSEFVSVNGGKRMTGKKRYIKNKVSQEVIGVETIYHFDARQSLYFVDDIWAQTKGQMPDKLIAFASSEFGGEICFDYRQSHSGPAIVLYDYEAVPGKEIGLLANSFSDFIQALGAP